MFRVLGFWGLGFWGLGFRIPIIIMIPTRGKGFINHGSG